MKNSFEKVCSTGIIYFFRFYIPSQFYHFKFQLFAVMQADMGSNAFAFKCILNTFRKYLHLRFSNEKYLHLKKIQILFKYIVQIQFILQVNEFAAFSFFLQSI